MSDSARIVIIGGGVGGASVAYHLTLLGERDVILLDRDELTSGSTFHSAGLVGQLRADPTLTRMNQYSVELYRTLDAGWTECGGIKLASTPERMAEIRRQIGWARTFGLPLEEISVAEAAELFPLMSTEGVVGAAYLPTDGQIDPSRLCYALAARAREGGARVRTRTRVLGLDVTDGRVTGVRTDQGDIACEVVVNCGGMFAAEIGRMAGVRVPIVPMSHQYVVTEGFHEHRDLPTLRDPNLLVYYRQEVSGLVMGGYERECAPWTATAASHDAIPADFNGRLLPEDWPRLEEIFDNSRLRVPAMADVGIRKLINGPEAFTPDNEFILGETEVGGFYVAAGLCAHGIAGAGGIGKVMAEWIVEGEPSMDLWHMDVRRFGAQYRSPSYTLARAVENYETYYDIRYPGDERRAGRPLRVSPAYSWHRGHGAVFGEKSGWERVNHYGSDAGAGDGDERPRGWAGRNWSPAIGAEHRATREAAGLFDESSFAKIEVTGPDAAALLEWVCDNRVARAIGAVTYTQALNRRGGIECDFTVTRRGEREFLIVTGTAFGSHDLGWLRKQARLRGADVRIADVTGQYACFALWGPRARDILGALTPDPLGFPFMTSRELTVGDVPVLALRVTFVGELGWELYCSSEYGLALWETLWRAGEPHGMVAGGYKAIDSLRLEKGYRVWGADIGPETTPYEAGLGFCVKMDKEFLGREALDPRPKRRLRCVTLGDPRAVALGNEPVRVDGEVAARVTSGGYGYTVGSSIAYAYLEAEPGTKVEIEVEGTWVPGTVVKEPLWDPAGERVR
ncbi:FAD-dependent oxidoreductase [Nonomuraea sp. NPDC049486]|uniref:GcvT family protein n=1 Tax=Nonomuraea sp. NPDC049486 TaxID=3155773 RepID=UPI0034478DE5